ncbi:MAG TPA: TIGR03086 family metal-binding protein [Streptosporangiaceae bacterium]|nr:TIGR03086 family metal-binding protein [Streptosporangiaceae bacterium]
MSTNPQDNIVTLDAQAVRESVAIVDRVTAADLARPTPCAGWTLQDLLTHMMTQHYGFAAASTGDGGPAQWQLRPLGDDPVAAYRASAEHVLAAFAVDGVLDRQFPLPEIVRAPSFPARQAISFHFIDYVVHSWDVAKTLGIDVTFDQPLLDAALAVAQAVPTGRARLVPGAAFAPVVPWSGGTRLDDILAILGRSPDWSA